MFANRFTVLADASSLAGALKRNLLLSLAEAEFFRLRWSREILDETERAITTILSKKGAIDAIERGRRARVSMEQAFDEALVSGFDHLIPACNALPDKDDAHVLAAALACRADMIVTENMRDFPAAVLTPRHIEAKPADAFIADTLSLDIGRGVSAIRAMRLRFGRPSMDAEDLLLSCEADGLAETVNVLRSHTQSL